MDHPDIERVMRMGYPDKQYLEWERQQELERGDVDELEDEEKRPCCNTDA